MSEVNTDSFIDAFSFVTDLFWTVSCISVSYHITYEVLSSIYEVVEHFTTTLAKDKNQYYSKQAVESEMQLSYVWIEACMAENGEGGNAAWDNEQ